MKRTILALLVSFCMLNLMACATMSAEQIGQGLEVGGVGSGSGGIALIGIVTESLGHVLSKPSVGSPEFEKRKAEFYRTAVQVHFMTENSKLYIGKPDTSQEQITESTRLFCADISQKVATRTSVPLSRKNLKRWNARDEYLPEGNSDIVEFPLYEDPFNGDCEDVLGRAGREIVRKERAKIANTR